MDISEQYIKMCDCPEIQETWKLKQGDWTAFPMTGVISIKHIDEDDDYYSPKKAKTIKRYNIWLPRQDQIQKIWSPTVEPWFGVILAFISWFETIDPDKYQSVEQLWLAFYIYEKHGKVWNGKKWMKHEEKATSAISR